MCVKGQPSRESLDKWRKGLLLDNKKTMAAKIKTIQSSLKTSKLQVTLKEGRNRQIRRIADFLGHPVLDLQRIAIAEISLQGLSEGNWRELNETEWLPIVQTSASNQPILQPIQ